MKTTKIILVILTFVLMISCRTYYRMETTLDRDGNVRRDMYAMSDSEFISENNTVKLFMFDVNKDWVVCRFDTAITHNFFGTERSLNVKISKTTSSIENYTKDMCGYDEKNMLATPEESLVKKWRFFYTTYSFKAIYHKFQYDVPISIDTYLSKEEQFLWTQGGMENYKVYNGSEINDYLNEIGNKIEAWYLRNFFEISIECINKCAKKYDLNRDKESIYKQVIDKEKEPTKINPKTVSSILDLYYKTTYFSKLYSCNEEILDKDFEAATFIIGYLANVIDYELVVPGKQLQTNAPIIHADTLVWKVDGMRLLFDNYSLTAEYRLPNRWAFVFSGLVLMVALGSLGIIIRKKRNRF